MNAQTAVQQIRSEFESAAYSGYVGYGQSMSDGIYRPISRSASTAQLRRSVPVKPEDFLYNTDFRPTQAECDAYNATFEVGASWKPDHLDLAVEWEGKGWKTYTVTGTRHAYYFIRKLAGRQGFRQARLNDLLVDDGYARDNVLTITYADATGHDRFGTYRSLLDRNNAHYDLERDLKERQAEADELSRLETQSDRDAWYDMDR